MCLTPISIVNPNKYVSLKYRDLYLLHVPCGKCAECQSQLSAQWMYRTMQEFNDCISSGGFIYFDTLTYQNKYLPHFSDYFVDLQTPDDYFCFNHLHITNFFKKLRSRLNRAGYKDLLIRYFLSSEYGMNPGVIGQNRPHYHVLFFVYGDINPVEFSQFVSSSWKYGRTDGYPYKSSSYVVGHNTLFVNDPANLLRTANYVTKYVQKNCLFQNELNKRISSVMSFYANKFDPGHPDEWQKTLAAYRIRKKLRSLVNQFHRQSLHYGETALRDIDLNQLFNDGVLYMPHYKGVKVPVLLPTYYKRKLFYRLLEIDGAKTWQLTSLGLEYKKVREKRLHDDLIGRFQCVCIEHHLNYDCKRLADYMMYERGRIKAQLPESTIEQRLQQLDLFNYSTIYDKDALSVRGLFPQFLGNSSIGYNCEVMPPHLTIKQFIERYVILDPEREKELSMIYYYCSFVDKGRQDAYELKQRLMNLFKIFR